MHFTSGLLALAAASTVVLAHPGEKIDKREAEIDAHFRHAVAEMNQRSLEQCSSSDDVRQRKERAMSRRFETFKRLREERGLNDLNYVHRRTNAQFSKWASSAHDRTSQLQYTKDTPIETVFGANTSCVFTPDNANGPYYVAGEHIRSNVVEDVVGIPVHLEMQFVDSKTCKPAPQLVVDIWSCNATGVYSGVSAYGEGGLKSTYLRGVQLTDKDGVVSFDTIFPGHYQGRATHQHVVVHTGSTILPNNTYTGGHVAHLSQFFYDQALLNAVEATAPYNTNRIPRTSNAADMFTGYSASEKYDPFPEYVMLGKTLQDGLFLWLEIALDTTANWDTYAPVAAYLREGGGVDNPEFQRLQMITASPPPTHG